MSFRDDCEDQSDRAENGDANNNEAQAERTGAAPTTFDYADPGVIYADTAVVYDITHAEVSK